MKVLFKFINHQKFKHLFIILILLLLFIIISAISYVDAINADISNNIFRLHVIANSNSIEDQNLKYKIRNNLINYMNALSQNYSSKDDVLILVSTHKEDFYNIAESDYMYKCDMVNKGLIY